MKKRKLGICVNVPAMWIVQNVVAADTEEALKLAWQETLNDMSKMDPYDLCEIFKWGDWFEEV